MGSVWGREVSTSISDRGATRTECLRRYYEPEHWNRGKRGDSLPCRMMEAETEESESPNRDTDPRDARSPNPLVRGLVWLHVQLTWAVCRLCWGVRVRGIEHMPTSGAALVVSNHPSYLDPMLIVTIGIRRRWRLVRFMAWDKLFKLPVIGAMLRTYGAFPVNVEKPGRESYQRLLEVLKSGQMGGIFPEGGRSPNDVMGKWKPGALRAALATGVPVLPVTVIGARQVWPDTGWLPGLFRRVEVVIHPARSLEQICERLADEPEKAWLVRVEETLQREVGAPLLARLRRRRAEELRAYRRATPAGVARKRGQDSIRATWV